MPRSPLQFQSMVAVVLALAITIAGFSTYRAFSAPRTETVCFQFHQSVADYQKDLER